MPTSLPRALAQAISAAAPGSSGASVRATIGLAQPRFEPLDQRRIGRAHAFGRVVPRKPLRELQERAGEVIAGHHQPAQPAAGHRRVERGEAGREVGLVGGDQRRQAEHDAGAQHRLERQVERHRR